MDAISKIRLQRQRFPSCAHPFLLEALKALEGRKLRFFE